MYYIKYLVVIFLFASCLSSKKVDKYLDKHPEYNAKNCAVKFPIVTDTVISQVNDTTVLYKYDTTIVDNSKVITLTPQGKIVTKTITIVKESTAKIAAIQFAKSNDSLRLSNEVTFLISQVKKNNEQNESLKAKVKALQKRNISLLLLVIVLSILLFRKPILRLIGLSL